MASLVSSLEVGLEREELQALLSPGAARNAIDCALWDLEAKTTGLPVWQLAELAVPRPLETAYTLSIDSPENLQIAAAREAHRPVLKLKLAGQDDIRCIQAVRSAAPASRIIVDANEAWCVGDYLEIAPLLPALGVTLLEQPFPFDTDECLAHLPRPVAIAADESCHVTADLDRLAGLYDVVNIKLDKTGGFTEALMLIRRARERGLGVMVGCMVAGSCAIAPAFFLAQHADYVDLDAPLLLAADDDPPVPFDGSILSLPDRTLWG
jgi:L-alanine-DL-glutamate epimerase-like enolase superfamily enzyme